MAALGAVGGCSGRRVSSMRRGRGRFSGGGGGGGGVQRTGSRRVRSRGAWMQHGERAGASRRVESGVEGAAGWPRWGARRTAAESEAWGHS
jgi:hypothetical protein